MQSPFRPSPLGLDLLGFRGKCSKGENAWEYVLAILEGRKKCEQKQYAKALKQASERWTAYKEPRHNLLAQLAHFELSPAQVERIANPDSPVRNHQFGTTEINRKIQAKYRGGMLNYSKGG